MAESAANRVVGSWTRAYRVGLDHSVYRMVMVHDTLCRERFVPELVEAVESWLNDERFAFTLVEEGGRVAILFATPEAATLFTLRWAS